MPFDVTCEVKKGGVKGCALRVAALDADGSETSDTASETKAAATRNVFDIRPPL